MPISDPNIAYMLILLGFYGIFFELASPGAIFPGVMGGICLILGFSAMQALPVHYSGLLLIMLGVVLFVLEVRVMSHGLLTAGGIIFLVLGSLHLFESPYPDHQLSIAVIIIAVSVTAALFLFTLRLAYKTFGKKPVTGIESMVGREGIAGTDITPNGGAVRFHGEFWTAYSDEPIPKGSCVVVELVKDLRVKVRRCG